MVMKQRGARLESLSRVSRGVLAPDQTEVTPAQTTPVGLNEPVERSFESVLRSDGSEIDGFAARTATGKEPPEDRVGHDHWASDPTAWDGSAE